METRGAGAVTYMVGDTSESMHVRPLAVADTTGAGDAFAGGLLGHLMRRPGEYEQSVMAGVAAAFDELSDRVGQAGCSDDEVPNE